MTSVFEGQPLKTRLFPGKRRVKKTKIEQNKMEVRKRNFLSIGIVGVQVLGGSEGGRWIFFWWRG